jgi:hypothetical protein
LDIFSSITRPFNIFSLYLRNNYMTLWMMTQATRCAPMSHRLTFLHVWQNVLGSVRKP